MHRLIYIGSPQFDGIGILNTEAQRMQGCSRLTILDGILPGVYPEIKNFSLADYYVWKFFRKRQFLSVLKSGALEYLEVANMVKGASAADSLLVRRVLEESIRDHCVCNNIVDEHVEKYRQRHWDQYYEFLCRLAVALRALFQGGGFSEVVVFNGRNTLAKLLVAIARDVNIPVFWLEYFGKRENRMTYIASPVDIFDFDAMSAYVFNAYLAIDSTIKEVVARECLDDRIAKGDPLLTKWGVDFAAALATKKPKERKVAAFFFSSEDEYPAVKSSVYGFQPPNEQYSAFSRICEEILKSGLEKDYHIVVKLHPRYAAEMEKLSHARGLWEQALENARRQGIELELVQPRTSAYKVIAEADVVFSYGSTAWEATYLGKPAVLMGPNFFTTHDCVYIANSVRDVIAYLERIPPAKPVENCYPYAWAWRELGRNAQDYQPKSRFGLPRRLANVLLNRFSVLDNDK